MLDTAERACTVELPLSFSQEQMLLNYETWQRAGLDTRGLSEHRAAFRINGTVDRDLLVHALAVVVGRHSSLRSAIAPRSRYSDSQRRAYLISFARHGVFVPGLIVQRVHQRVSVEVRTRAIDLRAGWTDALQRAVREDESEPLDLSRPPAIRVSLLGDQEILAMIVASSHITHDAVSGSILIDELERIYASLRSGVQADLKPAMSHTALAIREHRSFATGRGRRDEEYWWRCWQDAPSAMVRAHELPFFNKAYRQLLPGNGVSVSCEASLEDSHAVALAARRARVTLYSLFRAAMVAALYSWAPREAVAFWANFVNRHSQSDWSMTAWCSTTHLVTVRVPAGSFVDLIRNVSESMQQAIAHASVPLSAVWLRYGQDLTRGIDGRINFDQVPANPGPGRLRIFEQMHLPEVARGFDLDIRVSMARTLSLTARFNGERYHAGGVRHMLDGMMRLATGFVTRPDLTLDECSAVFNPQGTPRTVQPSTGKACHRCSSRRCDTRRGLCSGCSA